MTDEQNTSDNLLVRAAKTVGAAAGRVAKLAGVETAAGSPAKAAKSSGKLPKKNKTRLPRKQKKALARKANIG